MNKKILIVGGIIVAIAAALAFILTRNNPQEEATQTSSPQVPEEAANLVLSAFQGKAAVKCTYNNNDSIGTAYIKNGMVRIEGTTTSDDRSGNLILKNDTMWTWETGDDSGFMLTNISQLQKDSANIPEGYSTDSSDIRKTIEDSNPTCDSANIPDSTFEPPTDVKFQDYSSMTDDIRDQIPDDFKLPEGVELPEGYQYPSN